MICDGCNVREPFEHRCHSTSGSGRTIPEMVVRGERVPRACECEPCREEDRIFAAEYPERRPGESAMEFTGRSLGERRDV